MCGGGGGDGGAQAMKFASHDRLAVCTLCRCKRKCVFLRTRWTIDRSIFYMIIYYIITLIICDRLIMTTTANINSSQARRCQQFMATLSFLSDLLCNLSNTALGQVYFISFFTGTFGRYSDPKHDSWVGPGFEQLLRAAFDFTRSGL